MDLRKLLPLLLFGLAGIFGTAQAQTTVAPDTVCAGSTNVSYWVNGNAGSTYQWTISGNGTQVTGSNTDSITIDWSATPGTDTLLVVEMTSSGCYGDTILLPIVRNPLPTALVTGTTDICYDDSATVQVALTGSAPWSLTYTDGTNSSTVSVTSSPYTFNTGSLPAGTYTYNVTGVTDRLGCAGTTSGSAVVTANPKPTTSPIFHQ